MILSLSILTEAHGMIWAVFTMAQSEMYLDHTKWIEFRTTIRSLSHQVLWFLWRRVLLLLKISD